jgi:DNA ligase-associated metallophosphoesterase
MLEITVAGAPLRLLPRRAAFLPEAGVLLIADAHIGKAQSFRRLGVPVPGGTTAEALRTLSGLLADTGARRIVFLGDLLHSARSRAAASWAAVAQWRDAHADTELTLVRGNHDRHAGDPPPAWRVDCVDEPLRLGTFALVHHPQPVAGAYALAGHVHPAAVLGGRARERLRLPCFHFGPAVGVLPAFGDFTGMHVLPREPGDRVFVIADDVVRPLNSLS